MPDVCILGAGFGGLAAAILLQRAGHTVAVLERADRIGGTWRDARYPGCACDVASHLYSLSFELNPDWTRHYAGSVEIQAYLEGVADKHDLDRVVRCGSDIETVAWQGDHWRVRCLDGHVVTARWVVSALGALRDPRMPELPGLETFAGPAMHTGRWDASVDLAGKRVGVVGTGASAIQVVPTIVDVASEVHLFQRTPPWVVPRRDRPISRLARAAYRWVPGLMQLRRLQIYLRHEVRYPLAFGHLGRLSDLFQWVLTRHIRREIDDPVLAERLIPTYVPGCKRILLSDDYYPSLNRPHVRVHGAATAVVPQGLVSDGETVPLDVLIWCTGYRVDDPLGSVQVRGRDGLCLRQFWGRRPRGHLGITIPGFPNLFGLLGPNTALGHNSVVIMIEAQVRYLIRAMALAGDRVLEARPEALDRFMAEVDGKHVDQVWLSGCRSWYLNDEGENYTIWPGSTLGYLWRTRRPDVGDFWLGPGQGVGAGMGSRRK